MRFTVDVNLECSLIFETTNTYYQNQCKLIALINDKQRENDIIEIIVRGAF